MMGSWEKVRNVLCVRLDALGDVLMTTPAMRALKESLPGARLTLLASPGGAAIARFIPVVDDCLVYEAPWMKATGPRAGSEPDRKLVSELRARRFDAAVIFTVYSQNPLAAAFLCYLAEIPLRLGYCRENPYQLLTDFVPELEPERRMRHEVRRHLDLVAQVGCATGDQRMALRVALPDLRRIKNLLRELGLQGRRDWVVVHPGTTAPSRRYPPEHYAAAARSLVVDHGIDVLFTGSADECALVESIRAEMGASSGSLAGRLSLGEMAALLSRAPLLVSNNTGPTHMAAALGTPIVGLYALTNPQHTPWHTRSRILFHDVPCRWCYRSVCPEKHHDCLRLVPPQSVVTAALELLAETSGVILRPRWQPSERAA